MVYMNWDLPDDSNTLSRHHTHTINCNSSITRLCVWRCGISSGPQPCACTPLAIFCGLSCALWSMKITGHGSSQTWQSIISILAVDLVIGLRRLRRMWWGSTAADLGPRVRSMGEQRFRTSSLIALIDNSQKICARSIPSSSPGQLCPCRCNFLLQSEHASAQYGRRGRCRGMHESRTSAGDHDIVYAQAQY